MQEVSQAWISAQQQALVPMSYVEVSLTVGDPEAEADAEASSNGDLYIANTPAIVTMEDQSPVKYAMLEDNLWGLDGTFDVVPDSEPYGENGYIGSALCGADGTFADPVPTLTVSFSKVYTAIIPGITVRWSDTYEEYATDFTVTAYNGDTQVAQKIVTGNSAVQVVVSVDIENYDRIVITVQKWCLPYRRARAEAVTVGIVQTYTKTGLMSYEHTISVDPLSGELPNAEITFEVSNLDGQYNPDNPQGVEKYLVERREITARYGYLLDDRVEWIPAGVFFMSEWNCPQNGITATFTARDGQEYMTDLYTGASTGTLYAIADAAFTQAGLPEKSGGGNRWEIDSSLNNITAAGDADLSAYTIKEVLQLCANAACCVLYQDRQGVFHIEPLASGQTEYPINQFNSYANSEISLSKQLKGVDINNGQYTLSVGPVGETQQITNPLISDTQAPAVAQWVANYLVNRRELSGEFRADPRLDALDRVVNTNDFSTSIVLVTEVKYSYNGAFRGSYEGRAGV